LPRYCARFDRWRDTIEVDVKHGELAFAKAKGAVPAA
jgi:hypothetical protein